METTLERLIRKLEMNENALSTVLGGVVMLISLFLLYNYSVTRNRETNQVAQITPEATVSGQVSSTATTRYTIQPGDSLSSIAEEIYGDRDKWTEIAQANNIANPDTVLVGQEIDLPRASDVIPQDVAGLSEGSQSSPASTSGERTYTVEAGDYMTEISLEMYGTKDRWADIWQANRTKVLNPNILTEGTVLVIPE